MRISGMKHAKTMAWSINQGKLDRMSNDDLYAVFSQDTVMRDARTFATHVNGMRRDNLPLECLWDALDKAGVADIVLDIEDTATLQVVQTDGTVVDTAHVEDGRIVLDNIDAISGLRSFVERDNSWASFLSPITTLVTLGDCDVSSEQVCKMLARQQVGHPVAIINYLLYGAEAIEKLGDSFARSLEDPALDLGNARKRHQIIGLPQKLLQTLSGFKTSMISSELVSTMKSGNFEGNDMVEFASLLDAYRKNSMWELKDEKEKCDERMRVYILKVVEICRRLDCSLMKAAAFLAKQALCSVVYVTDEEKQKCKCFSKLSYRSSVTVPNRLASEYVDYLEMGGQPWPDDLLKAKSILDMHNKVRITDEDRAAFKAYGEKVAPALNYARNGYRFAVPTDYDAFMEIGYDFHNCLPVCGKLYSAGKLDIVFVYPPFADKPTAALEVKDWKVVQQVTYRDLPIADENVLEELRWYARYLTFKRQDVNARAVMA